MTLLEKFTRAWDNRSHIAEAIWNEYISSKPEIKAEAARRLSICKENTCGFWDASGTSDKLVMKGYPGCTACGCNGELKTNCMSCYCTLGDGGVLGSRSTMERALWTEMMAVEQERQLQDISYNTQQPL